MINIYIYIFYGCHINNTIFYGCHINNTTFSYIGCHINNTFIEALCYANVVTLLSPSIRGLNAMISLCEVFAKNFDITFNCQKTVCIKFRKRFSGSEHVYLNDKKIESCKSD